MPRGRKAAPGNSGVNKIDAVRGALAELGKDAMPADIQKAVKDKHGMELPTSLISNYKSYLHGKGKKKTGRKPGPKPAATAPVANANADSISLDDIRAVKALADKLGAEKVQQLARVLAK
jgi:hypothetical protein